MSKTKTNSNNKIKIIAFIKSGFKNKTKNISFQNLKSQ